MRSLKYTQERNSDGKVIRFIIFADNGFDVGDILHTEDGYWNYFPSTGNGGYIPSYMLKELSAVLDQLNGQWDFIIETDERIGNVKA